MKLNDSYLCIQTGCDEVFSYKDVKCIQDHIHFPICPVCGNKNVLNLGRVLNRKGGKENEDPIKRIPDVSGSYVHHNRDDQTKQSDQPDERVRTLFQSDRSKDAEPGLPKDPSNISGIRCPEDEFGTRLSSGSYLYRE